MKNKKTKWILASVTAFITAVAFCFVPIFGSESGKTSAEELSASAYVKCDFEGEFPINAARCAIVIDAESGNILYSKNADERRGMASTTKIMTALVAIENGDPDSEFAIPKEAVGIEGSSVYLKEGEILTLRELLYCLMLESGNDAATAIALCVGGSIEVFAEMMNARAAELGLKDTHFTNPHGLSDNAHYTTARELALITAEAMKYPLFCEIVSTKSFFVRYDGKENGRHLVNHNKLLFNYSYATGVKTGYTKLDGKCLVSSAESEGRRFICVSLQDAFPTATHKALLDSAFMNYEYTELAKANGILCDIRVNNAEQEFIKATNPDGAYLSLPKGASVSISLVLPESINAPVEEGEIIGYAVCEADGKEVYIIYLEATETVIEKKKSIIELLFGK